MGRCSVLGWGLGRPALGLLSAGVLLLTGSPTAAAASATASAAATARPPQHPSPAQALAAAPLVLRGVTVIDVVDEHHLADQTVVVTGNRIQAVGADGKVSIPKDARVVDARGKYVIPGLWDMHVHVQDYPQIMYPLAIANGVTGIRDMNTAHLDSLLHWRREIVAGTRVGPRVVLTGGYLGNSIEFDSQIKVTTPEYARKVVDSLKAAGVDFIKTRDGLSREVYFAAAAEARKIGIPLVGHLSTDVTMFEATDSGQRTVEHVIGCRTTDTDEECAALASQFRRHDAWVTPTLVALRYIAGGAAPERLRFWPDTVTGAFPGVQERESRLAEEAVTTRRLARAIRVGMPMLAGTDAAPLFPENTAGFSLHEELAWFVEGGMTPLAALRAATLNPARYLHATDSLGAVAPGKLADLVVLDADPLTDIHNIDKIHAVVANGRYFDRTQLDQLIADVEHNGRGRSAPRTP